MTEALSPTQWLVGVITALVAFFALDLWRWIAETTSSLGARGRVVRIGAAVVVGGWVGLALIATLVPVLRESMTAIPGSSPTLLAALVAAMIGLGFTSSFRRAFDAVPMESAMAFFYWRAVFGVWLLAGFMAGRLPSGFAIPAALGDIAVTMLAIVILAAKPATGTVSRWAVMVWNVAGFCDLLGVAVLAATVLRPWAAQRGLPGANFGLQLFVVPVFLGLHVHIGARLWREMKAARRSGMAPAATLSHDAA